MLFRRIKDHIEKENWFAVCVDFFIVVVGVFIGIQVANWNEERAFYDQETKLLLELRREVNASILSTNQKMNAYAQVVTAGKLSLDFLTGNKPCEEDCWPLIVAFLHASQWQDIRQPRSTYDQMRSLSLPRNDDIINAMEAYLAQNEAAIPVFRIFPEYRNLVRQLVPLAAQEYYWINCYSVAAGVETYNFDCPSGISNELAKQTVESIMQHPNIKRHLTQWIGGLIIMPISFASQNAEAELALAAIEAELERR